MSCSTAGCASGGASASSASVLLRPCKLSTSAATPPVRITHLERQPAAEARSHGGADVEIEMVGPEALDLAQFGDLEPLGLDQVDNLEPLSWC